jgi:hypothetical protein
MARTQMLLLRRRTLDLRRLFYDDAFLVSAVVGLLDQQPMRKAITGSMESQNPMHTAIHDIRM